MALIDLKSDLSKFRSDFQTPTLENKVNASKYNIDDLPSKHGNDVNQSNFKDISDTNFNYPNLLINGKRLMQPAGTKNSQPVITFPGPQNFLNDKDASGFTLNTFKTGQSKKDTQFKSYFNYTDFKKAYIIPDTKSTGPTGWQPGNSTLISQLGTGIPNLIKSYDSLITKTYNWYTPGGSKNAYHSGFHSKNRYSDAANINSITERGFLAATYNTNSPIDDVYKKYSLRDDAYNPTYMRHPLIVRGIQRKGNEKPQYWGFGSKSGFDDGLIRGGVVTVADRIVADTVRIAKFMASPKGLLWIVKQIGLGLTNAKVETFPLSGPFGRATRIHTGVASLLSVPGTALGLHFTRHGIPFANEFASYENVIKAQQLLSIGDPYSRLITLKGEFGGPGKLASNLIKEGADTVKVIATKALGSLTLSSVLGGPGSVYGIGFTQIRRVVDTKSDAVANAKLHGNFTQLYLYGKQYAEGVLTPLRKVDEAKTSLSKKIAATKYNTTTPGVYVTDKTPDSKVDISRSDSKNEASLYKNETTPPVGINSYITLAYGKIPKDKKTLRDFRSAIIEDLKVTNQSQLTAIGTGRDKDYYTKNNLEDKYGFGKLGLIDGVTRLNALGEGSFLVKGQQFNRSNRTILLTDSFRGDRVTALDISSGASVLSKATVYPDNAQDLIKFYFEDGDQGRNVMPFRCTLTGFSDSFSPGWDKIDIMGRPDGAYLYSSFERSISFSFTVAALSRSEMIPMWRKLNYLASYTMPDFNAGAKPSGPFMRITIGDMFQQTPGFITSLTYNIPDDATWDTASDSKDNKDAKQLPMMIEANVSFTIVADYRPQMMGRVYSLSPGGAKANIEGQWLADAET
jgi:hypothetical protein